MMKIIAFANQKHGVAMGESVMIYFKQLKIYKPLISGTVDSTNKMSFLFNFNILDSQKKITKCEIIIEMTRAVISSLTENQLKCEKIAYQKALNYIIEKIEGNQLDELMKKPDNENKRIEELENQPKPDLSLKFENIPELSLYDLDKIDLKYDEYFELVPTEVLLAKIYHILSEKFSNKE